MIKYLITDTAMGGVFLSSGSVVVYRTTRLSGAKSLKLSPFSI